MIKKQYLLLSLLVLAIIVADQASKYWAEHVLGPNSIVPILPIFNFSLAHNYGAAFGFLNQAGYLNGIKEIKPPLRLQATPFIAVYGENYHDKTSDPVNSFGHSINGGMDVKFGLSDAFTLDLTLIPDFGEAQSDNNVLNLSPFEVRFDENRQFFTEGTELFNKGGLFYSRRELSNLRPSF